MLIFLESYWIQHKEHIPLEITGLGVTVFVGAIFTLRVGVALFFPFRTTLGGTEADALGVADVPLDSTWCAKFGVTVAVSFGVVFGVLLVLGVVVADFLATRLGEAVPS